MQNIRCRRALSADDRAACLSIRHAVFVVGQNVPPALERDGKEDVCWHYMAVDLAGTPVATARMMPLDGLFKFQRVAVLEAYRGRGIGAALMRFMMDDLAGRDDAFGQVFFLSSQVSAIAFYERLGFVVCSDEFMDAGIAHRNMSRAVHSA